jgi:hypothetical protein
MGRSGPPERTTEMIFANADAVAEAGFVRVSRVSYRRMLQMLAGMSGSECPMLSSRGFGAPPHAVLALSPFTLCSLFLELLSIIVL